MSAKGMEHHVETGVFDGAGDGVGREYAAKRRVATSEALARYQDVRRDVPVLVAEVATRPAETGHHLIEDQQDAVVVTDCPHPWPVIIRRHNGTAA